MTASPVPGEELGRPNPPAVRTFLVVAGALVCVTGLQLFVLTERTDRAFAWTVDPPLTAAFLGAAYLAAMLLEWTAAREPWWVRARIGVVAVAVFTCATEVATLLHLDRFHLDAEALAPRAAAWAWLAVYTLVPAWMLVLAIPLVRDRRPDPPPAQPLPTWLRATLTIHGGALLPVAAVLFLVPERAAGAWPWALTPLTSRAVAAWLLAMGVLALHAARENGLERMFPLGVAWLVFGLLELVALGRYPGQFAWASPGGVAFLALVASALVFGAATLRLSRRSRAAVPARP